MRRYKLYILLFIITIQLLFSLSLIAQRNSELFVGAGVSQTHVRDKSMSPLMYSGVGVVADAGFFHISAGKTECFHLSFQKARLQNSGGNGADYLAFSFKNHTFYHKESDPRGKMIFGWSNNNFLGSYTKDTYGNFPNRFFYYTSFGPAGSYLVDFMVFERTFIAELKADIQLLGFYLRPSYVSSEPDGYIDPANSGFSGFLNSIDFFYPGNALDAGTDISLKYIFGSGNAVSINYRYQYSFIKFPESVNSSTGNWTVSLITKL